MRRERKETRRSRLGGLLAIAALGLACGRGVPDRAEAPPAGRPADLTGRWVVTGYHIPGTGAMNEGEATRWRGRPLRLSPDIAVGPGAACERPAYATRTAPRDSFLAVEYRLPAGALAPLAEVERLTVLDVSCEGSPLPAMGARLIAIDDSTALAPWDGVFFELSRDRDFRAIGQEPGWELRIREGEHIRFIYDYGSDTVTTPVPPRQRSPESGAILYDAQTESSHLQVVIQPSPCTDAMSGHPFETTVTVTLNGNAYRGCGGPLYAGSRPAPEPGAPSFVNRVWTVAESKQFAPGEVRVFLSDGTLVMTAPHTTPAFGSWRVRDGRLTIVEEGIDYPADVLELTHDRFRIRIRSPGEPVEILFQPADEGAGPAIEITTTGEER